jgi:tetratricopeptide (TPR) repeat protein
VGPDYYFQRGLDCLQQENYAWAVVSFTKAIEMNPHLEMAYYHRAQSYLKQGQMRAAVTDFAQFLEVDHRGYEGAEDVKELVVASIKNARLTSQRDAIKHALRSYGIDRLITELIEEYNPQHEYPHTKLYALLISDLQHATPTPWASLGFIQLLRNHLDDALDAYDRAIDETPGDPEPYYFTGVALLKKIAQVQTSRLVFKKPAHITELSLKAHASFMQALTQGFNARLCLTCGYKTSHPDVGFCMYCGTTLAS